MLVGAVIYFVSPIDLMPDWFPLSGLIDDAAVLVFVIHQIQTDLGKFQAWEAERNTSNAEKVIDLQAKEE
jgi:uncharacterized membrane protein YkvA (DUF1232 family)